MTSQTQTSALTASELTCQYRARQLSPVDAVQASPSRIESQDQQVNAFCLVDTDAALAQARASERRWLRGEPQGLLDGVPLAVKDLLLTRGWPTLRGSRAVDPGQPWEHDAPCVARARAHGAVLVGKTTTPEIGWKGVTDSPLTGVTRNPWEPSRTAGGSSGGSGAAVALGMVPLALGTDGGGSIRIPASFCGVVGLKPTYGRIPLWPASPFGTLAHVGPMAWTVEDAALMYSALHGPDPRDPTALPADSSARPAALTGPVTGMRVAFSPTLAAAAVDPDVAAAVRAAAHVFESLGAHVEETDPGVADPVGCFTVLWYAGAAKSVRMFGAGKLPLIDPGLHDIAGQGAGYTAVGYLDAAEQRASLSERMAFFFERYDLLLTPTIPIPPFEAGREVPVGWPHERWMSWTPFTYPFNLTQQPAASVPCGFTSGGLPIALQLVGAKYADDVVLRAAHAYQVAHPLTDRRPPAL